MKRINKKSLDERVLEAQALGLVFTDPKDDVNGVLEEVEATIEKHLQDIRRLEEENRELLIEKNTLLEEQARLKQEQKKLRIQQFELTNENDSFRRSIQEYAINLAKKANR